MLLGKVSGLKSLEFDSNMGSKGDLKMGNCSYLIVSKALRVEHKCLKRQPLLLHHKHKQQCVLVAGINISHPQNTNSIFENNDTVA